MQLAPPPITTRKKELVSMWQTKVLFLVSLHLLSACATAKRAEKERGPPPPPSLSFLVLGDWGGQPNSPYTTPAEVELAKVMGQEAEALGSQFTLALGDNFYDTGVKNVDDPRFKKTFEVCTAGQTFSILSLSPLSPLPQDVFTASSLQNPWYVVCGNHDHYGNCSAEIAYAKVSNRWNFPDYYYTKVSTRVKKC